MMLSRPPYWPAIRAPNRHPDAGLQDKKNTTRTFIELRVYDLSVRVCLSVYLYRICLLFETSYPVLTHSVNVLCIKIKLNVRLVRDRKVTINLVRDRKVTIILKINNNNISYYCM